MSQCSRCSHPTQDGISHTASSCGKELKKTFLSGVAVLTLSTVLVKIIGLFYKIPMLRYLGSVGMGYFNAAYEWYAMLCILFTAGLPTAVAMLIAKQRTAPRPERERMAAIARIEHISMCAFAVLGVLGSAVLLLCAAPIARMIDSSDTRFSLISVAPTMLFSCIAAAYRGYFQGFGYMKPTAISQLIEAAGKLVFGLAFAHVAVNGGMLSPYVAAQAMLGLSLGVALSCLYLAVCRRRFRPGLAAVDDTDEGAHTAVREDVRSIGKRLAAIALPVTLSSAVLSLTRIVDMAMILRRLQRIGYTVEHANALYGIYTTMAIPVFNLVPALLTSVSLALIPTLSAQIGAGERTAQRETVNTSLGLTALLSAPASLALALYSRPILRLLFQAQGEELALAAPLLSLLAVSVIFSGLITTTNAALQAYGLPHLPICSMLIGSLIKMLSAAILISHPSINIYGAPVSTLLCNVVIVGINLVVLHRRTGTPDDLGRTLIRPLFSTLPAVGIPALAMAYLSARGYSEVLLFAFAVPVTLLLVALLSLLTGVIGEQTAHVLPQGQFRHLLRRSPLRHKLRQTNDRR